MHAGGLSKVPKGAEASSVSWPILYKTLIPPQLAKQRLPTLLPPYPSPPNNNVSRINSKDPLWSSVANWGVSRHCRPHEKSRQA